MNIPEELFAFFASPEMLDTVDSHCVDSFLEVPFIYYPSS